MAFNRWQSGRQNPGILAERQESSAQDDLIAQKRGHDMRGLDVTLKPESAVVPANAGTHLDRPS